MKLNLGEGNLPVPGYVGIDRKTGQEIYPLAYPAGSVDEIRASHVLEHFGHRQTHDVLKEWVRTLKPGGVLKIAVPDFERIAQWYLEGRPDLPLQSFLVGGQVDDDDYHKVVFDRGFLVQHLQAVGLVNIQPWQSEIEDNAKLEVSLNLQGTKPHGPWPVSEAANKYSQFGEDGMLTAIFEKIGVTSKFCVDVGAADGILFSNVRQFLEQGWGGVLIEADHKRFSVLESGSRSQFGDRVQCINAAVKAMGENSLDNILDCSPSGPVPEEFDLLSIDIDGQDYYVWNSLLRYSPRVVVVEYDPEVDPMFIPQLGGEGQAGWNATSYVAAARGYLCIARTQTNLICIRKDILEASGMQIVKKEHVSNSSPAPVEPNVGGTDINGKSLTDKPVKILAVITVPRLGFNANWHSTIRTMLALNIHVEMVEGVFWAQCLTRGIEKVIAQDADIILTIDYDSIFDVQHVVKLLQLFGDHPEYSAIVPVQAKRECNQMLFGMNGSRDFSQALTPIASGHFGLTLFDAKAFARLPKPWFIDVPNADGEWGEGRVDCDMQFWKQFVDSGLKVGLANEVRVGHLELGISWPSKDFRKVSQSISDYREHGQPKECGGDLRTEFLK